MEWRIILPVLCLIGFLHVPVNAADPSNSTNSSVAFEFNIVFFINDTFIDSYFNMTNNVTIALKSSIISQVSPLFTSIKNFLSFDILQFRNGSIGVDGKLYFNGTDSKPSISNLTQILNSGNFSFTILTNLTKIVEVTSTAAPAVTSVTVSVSQNTASQNTTVQTPAKVARINLVFRILQNYKDIYADLNNAETKQLSDTITAGCSGFYKKRFSNFFRMLIRKFTQGSIVADSVLEFDTTNSTSPNVTEVTKAFTDAVANGTLNVTVDVTSINATDITNSDTNVTANTSVTTTITTTTLAVPTAASIASYNVTFKMSGNFTNDLSNLTSPAATSLSNSIIAQFNAVLGTINGYRRTFIWRFRSGSIIVDGGLEYNKASSPTAAVLAKLLADSVRNGAISLPIDPTSIIVTDSTGATANKSPVLASMLTAFWMTLASLLLSAAMH
ncbi:uncharacterized protein zgc:111983 [Puntigrus tetrazona]|uniref:uncharacterized protein zgc:111983 n=1 Tax=Puntigrus tetrazona TaxID=1606681 RepID=UPI001C8B03BD|nr:uncharacterized protein zgc:111983 [Puntigrus tetrazona]XP_043105416.1 uncharacterized protein zgc:111983 [Puntigrus tetrazona]